MYNLVTRLRLFPLQTKMAMELLDMNEDWKLTNKLRIEDSEQFYTLVRMHLSFILESNIKE